jgi:hypothetical protein
MRIVIPSIPVCGDTDRGRGILSSQVNTYYPMAIDLKNHYYSDSVLSAYNTTLTSMATTRSYYGVLCRNILQIYHDSMWKVYMPHDSTYSDTPQYAVIIDSFEHSEGPPTSSFTSVKPTTNIETLDWKIYPNPATTTLNIIAPSHITSNELLKYRIISVIGKEILGGILSLGDEGNMIDLVPLAKGIYILELSNKNCIQKFNFVKE